MNGLKKNTEKDQSGVSTPLLADKQQHTYIIGANVFVKDRIRSK